MKTYEFYNPVFTINGIEFRTVKLTIDREIPLDRTASKTYSREKYNAEYEMKSFENRTISSVKTVDEGFLSREAFFSIEFQDGSNITFRPVGLPYVDTDIYFEEINVRYRPKTYAGFTKGYPENFDGFAMCGMNDKNYFEGTQLSSFKLYLDDSVSRDREVFDRNIYKASIKGILDFGRKDGFVYNHKEYLTINVYPDIIHQLIEVGPDVEDKNFHMEAEK